MTPLYNRPYTNDELEVFRMCKKLKEDGCKNNTEAEKRVGIQLWHMSPSSIQILVKQWFYNREKIDLLLALSELQTDKPNTINHDGLTTQYSADSNPTNTVA